MRDPTVQFIATALQSDPTVTVARRDEILSFLTGSVGTTREPDRLLTRQEVAKRLAISCRAVDMLARAGRLRKVMLTGRTRGGRIPESAVQSLIGGHSPRRTQKEVA